MNDRDYFAHPALSQTGAKTLLRSPAQYSHERDNPAPPTDAMLAGQLLHAMVLEPASVAQRFSTGPDLSGVTTKDGKPAANPAATAEGKALVAAWTAANPGVAVFSLADWSRIAAMAEALLDAPMPAELAESGVGEPYTLRDLLADPQAKRELAIFWDSDGCPCKAKIDVAVNIGGKALVLDLKSTSADLTEADLSRAVATFGYHRQAAHYLEAVASQGVVDAEFWFGFVGKTAPHEVAWIRLTEQSLSVGAAEMARAKTLYRACTAAGVWPSAQEMGLVPAVIGLPRWYSRDSEV